MTIPHPLRVTDARIDIVLIWQLRDRNYVFRWKGFMLWAETWQKPSPLMGEGWEGVMFPAARGRDMKKHPVDGAHARARTLRQNMTEAERRVWQILRSHRMTGYQFRRQVPIGRYIADFVCPTLCARGARLIVEIDGGQHDRSSSRAAERSGFLRYQGYRVLRFWNNEVLANLDGVHQTIAAELDRITPPQPSPIEGELQGENSIHSTNTDGARPSAG
jgi:very-short-patch-repair endonuclease